MAHRSRRHPLDNALNSASTEQAKPIGFASVVTIVEGAAVQGTKCHNKDKGKRRAVVAVALVGVGIQPCTPVKLPSLEKAHIKAMVVILEAVNAT